MKLFNVLIAITMAGSVFVGCTRARTTSGYYVTATTSTGGSYAATTSEIFCSGLIGGNTKLSSYRFSPSDSASLGLYFIAYPGAVGTYAIDGINIGGHYGIWRTELATVSAAVHGTLTISSVSPDLAGTFVFTRGDSAVVTGSFNVPAP